MDHLHIEILNRTEALAGLTLQVESFSAANNLPRTATNDVLVALDEVVSNIIAYGYTDELDHTIEIDLRREDGVVVVCVSDDGVAFNPLDVETDLSGDLTRRSIGGVGIRFVKALMDECTYRRHGERNLFSFGKAFEA